VAAHGRVMGLLASVQSWVETAGLSLGGVVLAALGVRAGAAALAGVPVLAGLLCWMKCPQRRHVNDPADMWQVLRRLVLSAPAQQPQQRRSGEIPHTGGLRRHVDPVQGLERGARTHHDAVPGDGRG